jgi:hypothetical protein
LPDGHWNGQSINISESGVWAAFDQELDIWLDGTLSAVFGQWHVDLRVRVVRTDGLMAGLMFQDLSDRDRAVIKQLIGQSTGDTYPEAD